MELWKIRNGFPADVPDIANLLVKTWKSAYGDLLPANFLASLSPQQQIYRHRLYMEKGTDYLVCESAAREIIGFASFGPMREHPEIADHELYTLYVDVDWHGRGIGQALFKRVLSALDGQARKLGVWVMEGNPYRRFYDKNGFEEQARGWMELGGEKVRNILYVKALVPVKELSASP